MSTMIEGAVKKNILTKKSYKEEHGDTESYKEHHSDTKV